MIINILLNVYAYKLAGVINSNTNNRIVYYSKGISYHIVQFQTHLSLNSCVQYYNYYHIKMGDIIIRACIHVLNSKIIIPCIN